MMRKTVDNENGELAVTDISPGLYLHIPFCAIRCPFCNFAITTAMQDRNAWLLALEKEMELQAPSWSTKFDTVYLGGGTPSILPPRLIKRILDGIRRHFNVSGDAEITMEANPGNLKASEYGDLLKAGVNRLSLGIQSLDDDDLKFLGRDHTAQDGREAFLAAREVGFNNISVDMIYSLPLCKRSSWMHQMEQVTGLFPDHISAYMLTYEPGTPITQQLKDGKFNEPSDEEAQEIFLHNRHQLEKAGFVQYEVSSFASSPEFESRHNKKYWEGAPYLGLGPSAHSFRNPKRFWNTPQVRHYIRNLESNKLAISNEEILKNEEKSLERLFLGLRTSRGVQLNSFAKEFGYDLRQTHQALIQILNEDELIVLTESTMALTERGMAMADGIAIRFSKRES